MEAALILGLLLLAAAAHAQTAFHISEIAVLVAHGADLGSTEECRGAGRCVERNPWLARFDNGATFGAAKMGVAGVGFWTVRKLHDSHPTLAIVVNVALAATFDAIAYHNTRVGRP